MLCHLEHWLTDVGHHYLGRLFDTLEEVVECHGAVLFVLGLTLLRNALNQIVEYLLRRRTRVMLCLAFGFDLLLDDLEVALDLLVVLESVLDDRRLHLVCSDAELLPHLAVHTRLANHAHHHLLLFAA